MDARRDKLQKLPIGIQDFVNIREDGYLYVDKTRYLVDIIDRGKVFFFSRPRRFGKSLTISTFDALFSGKKELFKGPFKPLLNAIGGIPVDRKANKDIVSQMAEHFANNAEFNLVIAPEATRAKRGEARKPIRTGFWHIAKAAGVPIVLMYANSKTKQGGIFGKIYPTELDHDLALLKKLYKENTGLDIIIPESKN
mgnify:CR=1 FL=1